MMCRTWQKRWKTRLFCIHFACSGVRDHFFLGQLLTNTWHLCHPWSVLLQTHQNWLSDKCIIIHLYKVVDKQDLPPWISKRAQEIQHDRKTLAKLFSRIDADGSGQAYQLVGLAVGWDGLACVLNKIIHKSKGGSGMLVCGCSVFVCARACAQHFKRCCWLCLSPRNFTRLFLNCGGPGFSSPTKLRYFGGRVVWFCLINHPYLLHFLRLTRHGAKPGTTSSIFHRHFAPSLPYLIAKAFFSAGVWRFLLFFFRGVLASASIYISTNLSLDGWHWRHLAASARASCQYSSCQMSWKLIWNAYGLLFCVHTCSSWSPRAPPACRPLSALPPVAAGGAGGGVTSASPSSALFAPRPSVATGSRRPYLLVRSPLWRRSSPALSLTGPSRLSFHWLAHSCKKAREKKQMRPTCQHIPPKNIAWWLELGLITLVHSNFLFTDTAPGQTKNPHDDALRKYFFIVSIN